MSSAVLRVRWRDRELWLMGDALAVQERDLLALGDPGAGARLPPAEGRPPRQPERFRARPGCRRLGPRLALVSAGRRNVFDHPHGEAMAALRSGGARVYVTGTRLGVRVEAAEGGWRVEAGDGARWFLRAGGGPD